MTDRTAGGRFLRGLLAAGAGVLLYGGLRNMLFGPLVLSQWLAPFLMVVFSAGLAVFGQPLVSGRRFSFHRRFSALLLLLLFSLSAYIFLPNTATAWVLAVMLNATAGGFFLATLGADLRVMDLVRVLGLAVFTALLPVLIEQMEDRFAREEFFVLLDAVLLLFPGLLLSSVLSFWRGLGTPPRGGMELSFRSFGIACLLIAAVLSAGFVKAYQGNFYPQQGPTPIDGVTHESPFLCEPADEDSQTASGEDLTQQLVGLIESKSVKSTKDLAFLFLATGDADWAGAYRETFLQEVRDQPFTQPAGSVKYGQYLAGQQIYFYLQMVEAQPDLFTAGETDEILRWVRSVNERALTIGWVDLLYALSFSKLPDGPYENQENGPGLLALIEVNGLSDDDLSARNRAYLEKHAAGWNARFRNSDDAVNYQAEWIENAWHQAAWDTDTDPENVRRSFEWLLLQTPPSGAPLRYNHLASFTMADLGNLAYARTGDPVYLWLADRAAGYLAVQGISLGTRPGMEHFATAEGFAPHVGSCILYGDSGLPNQVGPLLPDKVILRDGWDPDDKYLLLNLRFTGWHRYKATNSIVALIKGETLVEEDTHGAPYDWLPEGRSLLRDKRIPRENLNGLLVPVRGMDAVLYALVGSGSVWAQNPPYTADVVHFAWSDVRDEVVIQAADWNGRRHQRAVLLYHDGPVIVADDVKTADPRPGAIAWHLAGNVEMLADRYRIETGNRTVEMVPVQIGVQTPQVPVQADTGTLIFEQPGDFRMVTVFLFDEDLGAAVTLDASGTRLIIQGSETYSVDLPDWH